MQMMILGYGFGSTVVRLFSFAANLIHHAHELLFFVIPPEGVRWIGGEWRGGGRNGMAHSRRPVKVN